MRFRHRHINPGSAGAAFALDSRFGFSQDDNTDVSTWSDRTAAARNATQSTTAYKPKYRTRIQGGQPAIQFTAAVSSRDRLDGSLTITNGVVSAVLVGQMESNAPNFARFVVITKNSANDYDNASRASLISRVSNTSQVRSERNAGLAAVSFTTGAFQHFTNTFDGTNVTNRVNESASASAASSGNFDTTQFRVGMSYDSTVAENSALLYGGLTGYVAHVAVYNSALSDSLRKRLQFANAYSFKVACN